MLRFVSKCFHFQKMSFLKNQVLKIYIYYLKINGYKLCLNFFFVYFNLLNLFQIYSHIPIILGENMVKGTRGAKVKVVL